MVYKNEDIVSKIIFLSEIEFSKKIAESCVEQGRKFGVNIIPFKGVHGYKSEDILKKFSLKQKYFFKGGRKGVIGCFLSHYLLWLECIKLNKPYLILEHDGYFIRNLERGILDKFDDVLKLDNENPYSDDYDNKVNESTDFIVEKYNNPKTKNTELNETGNYLKGAYSYIIKPKAAKKIVEWIKINGFLPADIQIGDKLVNISVVKPTIVRLHPLYNRQVIKLSLTRNII